MAKIKVSFNRFYIVSELDAGAWENARRHYPEALVLKDEDENEYFSAGLDCEFRSHIGKCGVTFMDIPDIVANTNASEEEFPVYTVCASAALTGFELTQESVGAHIMEKYGPILENVNKVEEQVRAASEEYNQKVAVMTENIEFC